ncbi:MAG: acyl-CoA dehydrogenase [Nitrosomonadales bacterium]|nr:acyl-CoA dehydrogenase [Nitrosomonadales bacterium]
MEVLMLVLVVILLLAFFRSSIWGWLLAMIVFVPVIAIQSRLSSDVFQLLIVALVLFVAILGLPALRRLLVSGPILKIFRKILPQVSQTEQEALDAGTVWWDGDLFGGNPDWHKLLSYPKATLTPEEQAFLDNETDTLCSMLDDWDITHVRQDLPPHVWQFIKDKGFFGMIVPKRYGGLEFSAQMHSAVVTKVASRSGTAAVTVMVPNSLGPAELLLHYGTVAQKEKYLRGLAQGKEVPCFALTGPFAGSDAGAIPDYGIVCRGEFEGKPDVLGLRVTWEKRYITLAPVATLLGLAFKLYDPEHLLGSETERGITLALIPTDTPGVNVGRRHFPLNSAFQNGPTSGKDVFIPLDYIIGGQERIGQGWRMLMECLAAGRSISLPASATGGCKTAARTCGAYGRVRKQFKMPVGKFEGVEEAMARVGGNLYMMDAARKLTAQAVDMGEKPSVISAIVKYHCTERGRIVINDAMDVHGGKGICMGPDNYLARFYQQTPIGITVEGANILTRSMIIFGQGAIRSHPYVLKEIQAAHDADAKRAVHNFDSALLGHISFSLSNAARALIFGITGGHGIPVHADDAVVRRYCQQLTRYASAFALAADVSMLVLGGSLKRHEKISARLGDVLSQLYLCSATLKRFQDEGHQQDDLPLLHWSMQDALYRTQQALDGVLHNFPSRLAALILRGLIFPLGRCLAPPSDELGHQVSTLMMQPGAARDRLTAGMFLPSDENDAVGALDAALHSTLSNEPLQAKIDAARKSGQLKTLDELERISEARNKGVIGVNDALLLERDYALRRKVIMVDDFAPEQLAAAH